MTAATNTELVKRLDAQAQREKSIGDAFTAGQEKLKMAARAVALEDGDLPPPLEGEGVAV